MTMSEKKVVALFEWDRDHESPVIPEIVSTLERFLEEAKRGEIDGIAIAISRPNDTVRASFHFGTSSFRLFGAVAFLQRDLTNALQCVCEDVDDDAG